MPSPASITGLTMDESCGSTGSKKATSDAVIGSRSTPQTTSASTPTPTAMEGWFFYAKLLVKKLFFLYYYISKKEVQKMYLKKLELYGFKSFADKTTLEFMPGITTVIRTKWLW